MKNTILLALALGLATAAQAQQTPAAQPAPAAQSEPATKGPAPMISGTPGGRYSAAERAKNQTAKLTEQLQLDAATAEKVEAILRSRMEKVEALRTQQAAAVKPQVKSIKMDSEAALKGVLTPEQYAKYVALNKERRADKIGHRVEKRRHQEMLTE